MSTNSKPRKSKPGRNGFSKELPLTAYNLAPPQKELMEKHAFLNAMGPWVNLCRRYRVSEWPADCDWKLELIERLAMDYAPEFKNLRRKEKWSAQMNADLISEVDRLSAEGSSKKKIFETLFDVRDEIDFIPNNVASPDAIRKHYIKITQHKKTVEDQPYQFSESQADAINAAYEKLAPKKI